MLSQLCIAKFRIQKVYKNDNDAPIDGFEIMAPSLRHARILTEKLQRLYGSAREGQYILLKLGFSHYFEGSEREWELQEGIEIM